MWALLGRAAGDARAAEPIRPVDAARHVGENVVVEGLVDSVVCSPNACLLSFEAGFSGLIAAIPGEVRGRFPDPESAWDGRRLRVRGTVENRAGRPRIELRDPSAVEVLETGARPSTPGPGVRPAGAGVAVESAPGVAVSVTGGIDVGGSGASPGRAAPVRSAGPAVPPEKGDASGAARGDVVAAAPLSQAKAAEMLGRGEASGFGAAGREVRVETAPARGIAPSAAEAARRLGIEAEQDDLPTEDEAPIGDAGELALVRQDLAEIAGRLQALEAAIGEVAGRVAVLEEVAAPALAERDARAASVGSMPSRGGPSLERIRRGSTARQVLRLMGEPDLVEANPRGQFTWSWGGGRAVTVDAGGTVVSAIGF